MSTEPHHCQDLDSALGDPNVPIEYVPAFREISVRVLDGGTSSIAIAWCPFCGAELADSLRDEWFDRLEDLGLEPESPDVPEAMRADCWWRTPSNGSGMSLQVPHGQNGVGASMRGADHQVTELAALVEFWPVELRDGRIMTVAAHSYVVEGQFVVFYLLLRGSPHVEVESLRLPLSLLPEGFQ